MNKTKSDKFLTACSVGYVTLPVVLFACGWLRYYFSVPFILIVIYFIYRIYQELSSETICLINKDSAKFWLITSGVIFLWVLISGIGGFCYQNWDFIVRNPIYHDLCNYKWPVVYDLSLQSEAAQAIMGSGKVAFSYYFSWWLPPALISKIFSLSYSGQELCLYFWAVTGIFLVTYNLCRLFRKNSYIIPVIFIFFSGLDIIGYLMRILINARWEAFKTLIVSSIDGWAGIAQYSSNTTQLFWVFNQSIAVWLIVILLLQLRTNKNSQALSSLTLAYSPWAVFGIIPISIASLFHDNKKFTSGITLQNILLPLAVLIFYGVFYLSSNGSRASGTSLSFTISSIKLFAVYVLFIFLEVGIYFILMGKSASKNNFYYVVLIELFLFPTYRIIDGNFIMRGSIPALFILMTFLMKFFLKGENSGFTLRKRLLVLAMIIGASTPLFEINRSAISTIINALERQNLIKPEKSKVLLREEIHSLGLIKTNNTSDIEMVRRQFYISDYENSLFFKYLAK